MANDICWTQEVDEESGRTYLFNSETMDVIFIPTEWSAARSINDDRGNRPQVNIINGEAVLTQQSAIAMVGTRRGQGQPFSTQVLARMAGTTAGFGVGTVVTSVGFGPMVGITVGAAVAKTVEKAVESGIKWLGRKARSAYHATLRAWYGKAHFNRLQSELHGAFKIYALHEPHDEAMRLSASLKAEYCRRFPHWENGFQ